MCYTYRRIYKRTERNVYKMKRTEDQIADIIDEAISTLHIDHSDAQLEEVYTDSASIFIGIPNRSTLRADISFDAEAFESDEALEKHIAASIREQALAFSADEEFEELWTDGFGEHHELTAEEFYKMLEDDEKVFHSM